MTIQPKEMEEMIPASRQQEGIWFHSGIHGTSYWNYIQKRAYTGNLQIEILRAAVAVIVGRHPALRTNFRFAGERLYQVVNARPATETFFYHLAFGRADEAFITERISAESAKEENYAPDLGKDPLMRFTVLEFGPIYCFILTIHHIVTDVISMQLFWEELIHYYNAMMPGPSPAQEPPAAQQPPRAQQPPAERPLPANGYREYCIAQEAFERTAAYREQEKYWHEKLSVGVPLLNLGFYGKTAPPRPYYQWAELPAGLAEEIRTLSLKKKVLYSAVFQTAWFILLHKYSNNNTLAVGNVVNGRGFGKRSYKDVIGLFAGRIVNILTIGEADTVAGLLSRVNEGLLAGFRNSDVPYEALVRHLNKGGGAGAAALMQSSFNMIKDQAENIAFTGVEKYPIPPDGKGLVGDNQYDIGLTIQDNGGRVRIRLDLKCEEALQSLPGLLLEGYLTVLNACVHASVGAVADIRVAAKKARAGDPLPGEPADMGEPRDTGEPADLTIVQLFAGQAARTPEAEALVFGQETVSYRQLDERSNRLAHELRRLGVRERTPVAICIERRPEMIIGVLGILKAAGAYVPIDAQYPEQRIDDLLQDTAAPVVLTSSNCRSSLPPGYSGTIVMLDEAALITAGEDSLPPTLLQADDPAYILYTSGSTGNQKGVCMGHRALVNLLQWQHRHSGATTGTRTIQYSPLTFDVSFQDIFATLTSGGVLVLIKEEWRLDARRLLQYIEEQGINRIFLPFVALQYITEAADALQLFPAALREVMTAGEQLKVTPQIIKFFSALPGAVLYNQYGPTEAHVVTELVLRADPAGWPALPNIGRPIDHTGAWILDAQQRLMPDGASGELCLSGVCLAAGYLNRPELTAAKFRQWTHPEKGPMRIYCTGDLARYLPDGNIEFLGRIDHQVKIRGYRVELGEIEVVLNQAAGIRQAVVVAREDAAGTRKLVAYVVSSDGEKDKGEKDNGEKDNKEKDSPALRQHIARSLPDYMIPAAFVWLDELPRTTSGKIDRLSLPDPDTQALSASYVAPRDEREAALAEIWRQLLGVERVGIYDNFFELGGHSLAAIRVVSLIARTLDATLQIRDIFDHPTLLQLCAHLQELKKTHGLPPMVAVEPRPELIPLSYSQERLWFIDQMGGSTHYHIPRACRLRGPLDPAALEAAFKTILRRHEVLRTVIRERNGGYYQQVGSGEDWEMEYIRYSGDELSLQELVTRLVDKPFDLSTDAPLRVTLIRVAEEEHVLVMVIHHIAADGWSCDILWREADILYRGGAADLLPLPMQYADYAIWQRRWLTGEHLAGKLDYWRTQLSGIAPLELPTDHPRPAMQSTRGASLYWPIAVSLHKAVQGLSLVAGTTEFMTLLAAVKVLLFRYSGETDICVGTPVTGRTQPETEGLIGFFINTLPLRTHLDGNPRFTELLAAVKNTALEAYDHQDAPFEKIVEEVLTRRDLGRSPLFQVMFMVQHTTQAASFCPGETAVSDEPAGSGLVKFDLTITIAEEERGPGLYIAYCRDLYEEDTIRRMGEQYLRLLRSIVETPDRRIGELELLTAREKRQLVVEFNGTETGYPREATLVSLFTEQTLRNPEATALVFGEQTMSYGDLDKRSNRLAHHLRKKGVKEETPVAICMEPCPEMIVAILGVLKAGAFYVPIDPQYPDQRIGFILQDTAAPVVITRPALAEMEDGEDTLPVTGLRPEHLAYVIYTSGSTGQPKGVMIEHRNVVRLFRTDKPLYDFNERDVWTLFHSFAFDFSVWEIFGALLFGGRLVIVPRMVARDVQAFARLLMVQGVTVLNQTPSAFYVLQDNLTTMEEAIAIRLVIFGGEALDLPKVAPWKRRFPGCRLINMYGITETTVHVTYLEIADRHLERSQSVVGVAIPTTTVYILDPQRQPAPMGVAGELYVGGKGLARGYLNREELTAERFVADPFSREPGARLYRSGDLGRWLPDGTIEYLGRGDNQVKIRGYRIELGEIENCVLQSGIVRQCVVTARQDGSGLVGYVVTEQAFDRHVLLRWLNGRLPGYMIPALWMPIDAIPLTTNGKTDRKALPDPDTTGLSTTGYVAPASGMEITLAGIWRQLLDVERVGILDNFFELGGNSLLIMKLATQLKAFFKKKIGVITLFQYPTIKSLLEYLQESGVPENKEDVFSKEELIKELDKFIHIYPSI